MKVDWELENSSHVQHACKVQKFILSKFIADFKLEIGLSDILLVLQYLGKQGKISSDNLTFSWTLISKISSMNEK